MKLFFDTSALVKLFSDEEGSETVRQLVTNPSNDIIVLELALIELISAVFRKFRNNEIPEVNLKKIQQAIQPQLKSTSYEIIYQIQAKTSGAFNDSIRFFV